MFVLAHLTDPHIAPLPEPRIDELIGKRALGYLNWRRGRDAIHRSEVLDAVVDDLKARKYDHLAVTGDLINIALDAEFAPARRWLDSLGAPDDVTLVPGNHDAYVRGWATRSVSAWGPYMQGDGGEAFPFVRRRGPVALIGLSSAVPTLPFMATGRLGKDQLARLEELLAMLRSEGLYRVVLIHHPPASKTSRHLKRLTDSAALRAVLRRQGAELILHGHDHERSIVWFDGPSGLIPALGTPSASAALVGSDHSAGYSLFEIDGKAGAWRSMAIARGFSRDGKTITEQKWNLQGG